MNVYDYAEQIFTGKKLEDKLISPDRIEYDICQRVVEEIDNPGRSGEISFSKEQIRFPKIGRFYEPEIRAKALHFFANHELLAIEMFSWAILKFSMSESEQKILVQTIKDEQKHFTLYCKRIKELGSDFGSYPLNDFFWKTIASCQDLKEFLATASLTFEQANLDFSLFYSKVFEEVGDSESMEIMKLVYQDEISHVARGLRHLEKEVDQTLTFSIYSELLPEGLTPARAKGMVFDHIGRDKAGLSTGYRNELEVYKDDFKVTHRKQWK